jgi:hypothetical protein
MDSLLLTPNAGMALLTKLLTAPTASTITAATNMEHG